MLVDVVPAVQEFHKIDRPDGDGERQADARPDRVAPAHPIPEAEHLFLLYAELMHLRQRRRDGGEMIADRRLAQRTRQPSPRGAGVGHRLLRRERLGRHDEQRARRVEPPDRVAHVRAVDVGDEMAAQLRLRERRQRLGRHGRPKVRSADADIDDVGERLPQRTPCAALTHVPPQTPASSRARWRSRGRRQCPRHSQAPGSHCVAPYAAQRGARSG